MDSQYPYGNSQNRTTFDMIRTMQPSNFQFDEEDRRRRAMQSGSSYGASNGYPHPGSHLPPLNSSGHNYSQLQQPRSQQTSPVSANMPFPVRSYPAQPQYSPQMAQYSPSSFQPQGSYGFSGSSIGYQGGYNPQASGIPDFQSMTSSHAPPLPSSMAPPSQYSMAPSESDLGRTHVVGAQGRRGILPSDEGRPSALGRSATGRQPGTPQKDENGKFPCQHCNKTYLHAKHLKRHMLRHTGDRPYTCVLCSDTFSRSDILKRHFQKCSIRRGNPTGATHLSNPSAYNKRAPPRKSSTSQSNATEGRPMTSDSESAASTGPSAPEGTFDHHGEMIGGGDTSQNHLPGPAALNGINTSMAAYSSAALYASPVTSPNTSRPPINLYPGTFAPNGSSGYPTGHSNHAYGRGYGDM